MNPSCSAVTLLCLYEHCWSSFGVALPLGSQVLSILGGSGILFRLVRVPSRVSQMRAVSLITSAGEKSSLV